MNRIIIHNKRTGYHVNTYYSSLYKGLECALRLYPLDDMVDNVTLERTTRLDIESDNLYGLLNDLLGGV